MSSAPIVSPLSFQDVTAGALVSLAAEGDFNAYVTCQPSKTHFPGQSFKRHTHFAVAHVFLPVQNKPAPNYLWPENYQVEAKVGRGRIGDLLGKVLFCTRYNRLTTEADVVKTPWVERTNERNIGIVNHFAFAQIKETSLEVGTQTLEKHTGEALFIMDQYGHNGKNVDLSYAHGSVSTVYGSEVDPIGGGSGVFNQIADEHQLRVCEPSEFSVNLQFHMGRGDRPDDLLQMMWPLVSTQYQELKFKTSLRAKIGLLKSTYYDGVGTQDHDTDAELTALLTNATANVGKFELLDMYYCLQTVFLSPQERAARAKTRDERIIKYVDVLAEQRFQAGDSSVEFKLESENNTSDYIVFARRDNALHYSAKDYFDFSVNINEGLVPQALDSPVVYFPRNPLNRITLLANNNVLVDATAQHLHQNSALLHNYNKVPTQFIMAIPRTLAPHIQSEDYGSQADSKIDSLVMKVQLARTNDAATGIDHSGTIYVLGTKWSRVIIDKGQVGIEFPTH